MFGLDSTGLSRKVGKEMARLHRGKDGAVWSDAAFVLQITIDRLHQTAKGLGCTKLFTLWLALPLLSFTLYFVLPSYKKVVQQRFAAAANVALLVYYRILCPRRNDCPVIN